MPYMHALSLPITKVGNVGDAACETGIGRCSTLPEVRYLQVLYYSGIIARITSQCALVRMRDKWNFNGHNL